MNSYSNLKQLQDELLMTKSNGNETINSDNLESLFMSILCGEKSSKNIHGTKKKIAGILQQCLDDNVALNDIFEQLRQYDILPFISEKKIAQICHKYKLSKPFDLTIKEKFTSDELQEDFMAVYIYIVFKNPQIELENIVVEWREKEFTTGNFKEETNHGSLINTLKLISFVMYKHGLEFGFIIE